MWSRPISTFPAISPASSRAHGNSPCSHRINFRIYILGRWISRQRDNPSAWSTLSRPDLKRFPRFKIAEAQGLTARTRTPGDAILIPSMWWHQVEAIGELNTLINYWFRDPAGAEHHGPPLAALQHAMLAFKDLANPARNRLGRPYSIIMFLTKTQPNLIISPRQPEVF